ncbi:MAG: amidohydrolase family protein, partial [Rhodobacteraceae bacterium]|nr:amidohydrolase family protein [Paracoccaceae bacterium]
GIPEDEHPHPRRWGTFPRIIGHYARDLGLLTMSEAIHKMTGLPAKVFGLGKRGRIAPGHFADLVIFDPKTIIDKADYDNPKVPSEGINAVWVNGKEALNSGSIGVSDAGRLLQSDFS